MFITIIKEQYYLYRVTSESSPFLISKRKVQRLPMAEFFALQKLVFTPQQHCSFKYFRVLSNTSIIRK